MIPDTRRPFALQTSGRWVPETPDTSRPSRPWLAGTSRLSIPDTRQSIVPQTSGRWVLGTSRK